MQSRVPHQLDENSPRAQQPPRLRGVQLRPHQLALLQRCFDLETQDIRISPLEVMTTRVGVIGDKVGSGKSYVILALAVADEHKPQRDLKTLSYAQGSLHIVRCEDASRVRDLRLTVLVVPHGLVAQWSGYLNEAIQDSQRSFVASNSARIDAFGRMISRAVEGDEDARSELEALDILLVNTNFFRPLADLLAAKRMRPRRLIFDEADSIRNVWAQPVKCGFTWLVTASFQNLLSYSYRTTLPSTGCIRDLAQDLTQQLSERERLHLVARCSDDFVDSSFRLPEVISNVVRCRTPHIISILDGNADRRVMDRLHAGDLRGALHLLDPHTVLAEAAIVDTLIGTYTAHLSRLESSLAALAEKRQALVGSTPSHPTERAASGSDPETSGASEAVGRRVSHSPGMPATFVAAPVRHLDERVSAMTAEADRLRCRVASIRERVIECDACTICYEALQNKTITRCCGHAFCLVCINTWLTKRKVCPTCKAPLDMSRLLVANDEFDAATLRQPTPPPPTAASVGNGDSSFPDGVSPDKSKADNFEAMIRAFDAAGRKTLVFANFDNSLENLQLLLERAQVRAGHLKGTPARIARVLASYNSQRDLNVLLVNASNYGSGLNLQNTTDIIMFHELEPGIRQQVIGRAQRAGRRDALNVWYLLHERESVHG